MASLVDVARPASINSCWMAISVAAYSPSPKWWVADAPLRVGEIDRRPIVVVERAPHAVVVVLGDRPVDAEPPERLAHVVEVVLEGNSGVWAPMTTRPSSYFRCPRAHVGQRAQPVDAGVRPEVTDDPRPAALLASVAPASSHAVAPSKWSSRPSTGSSGYLPRGGERVTCKESSALHESIETGTLDNGGYKWLDKAMRRVGVAELKNNLLRNLRLVEEGEVIEVTDHRSGHRPPNPHRERNEGRRVAAFAAFAAFRRRFAIRSTRRLRPADRLRRAAPPKTGAIGEIGVCRRIGSAACHPGCSRSRWGVGRARSQMLSVIVTRRVLRAIDPAPIDVWPSDVKAAAERRPVLMQLVVLQHISLLYEVTSSILGRAADPFQ